MQDYNDELDVFSNSFGQVNAVVATPNSSAIASQVPEPASIVLACGGLLALLATRYGAIARRKRALQA
jgi:hypothetical protein